MNRLAILLAHLLKWQYPYPLPELGGGAYQRAILVAARETDKDEDTFPATFEQTGWSWEQQVLDMEYFPDQHKLVDISHSVLLLPHKLLI